MSDLVSFLVTVVFLVVPLAAIVLVALLWAAIARAWGPQLGRLRAPALLTLAQGGPFLAAWLIFTTAPENSTCRDFDSHDAAVCLLVACVLGGLAIGSAYRVDPSSFGWWAVPGVSLPYVLGAWWMWEGLSCLN